MHCLKLALRMYIAVQKDSLGSDVHRCMDNALNRWEPVCGCTLAGGGFCGAAGWGALGLAGGLELRRLPGLRAQGGQLLGGSPEGSPVDVCGGGVGAARHGRT